MARKPATPKGPTPIESIVHDDKRSNIPTADAQDFVPPEVEAMQRVAYDRDPSLDPQLIWRGKYPDDRLDAAGALGVDAPPIYIQEKIDPRVLVENLRRTTERAEDEPELTLFDAFDGLDELDAVDFYRHQANWSNRMILGDSLQVMASLAERESLRGKVQMIYIDPPYGIKFGSNWQVSARQRDVKDGKISDAAREAEQIKAFRDTWELGIHSYLGYLRDRLIAARELLTESGSCFVQIGDENVHLVRSLMDEVFGAENFVAQVMFSTTSGFTQARTLPRSGDFVLWYARHEPRVKYRTVWRESKDRQGYDWLHLADGTTRGKTAAEKRGQAELPSDSRVYKPGDLQSQGAATVPQPFIFRGRTYSPGASSHWKASFPLGMARLALADRIHVARNSIQFIRYESDFGWQPQTTSWTDTATGSFTDEKLYVVQTNTKVIERCLMMCTDPGDLVLDPTCGSGTTALVAEQWGRRWITIDTSRVALALARQRLMGAKFPFYLLADSDKGRAKEQQVTQKLAPPASVSNDMRHGFVYERVQHITLKSIANNPDIVEGMSREQIDAAIKKHADFELLYDRPYEDRGVVRVTGPFTVESLSPHRSLAFAGGEQGRPASEIAAETDGSGTSFEQTILENLRRAGVQNGRTAERIKFESLDPHAGTYVQAIGEGTSGEASLRVGVAIGPQYGIVSPAFVKDAAREAIRAGDVDLLCVLAFAFDPQATGVTTEQGVTVETADAGFAQVAGERQLGRVKVLLVRMNVDLLMGEDLKKTGAGNLFTVFGEPDIDVRSTGDDRVVVELRGVDVYDPATGEVRSHDTGRIALWMIDTDYNEESFFVRHCYFTGGGDPYKRLKTALKAEIDEDAWASLNSTVSRPFAKPTEGKIAVKVINDYGDEVMKVFEVG
ncbi:site-specific DNA-methyltransferase [Propioniciclava tarda]|uniref:Site-specific DNA-methyltransferase n=1 Tax=Propioniciclava tarda TaxID=433330 RepID=A0A4Q9KJ33_PROTD|nr:site-specific DNA-methyltransferase [Propioniciclava tarda]TBT94388.1 site-specific DNA-methyltransferase [Propioniciclava tarda]SMO72725.1 adenine-specific DNA-methyltransferase [Propioniciclava tarda]